MRKIAWGLLVALLLALAGGVYALLTIGSPYVSGWLQRGAERAAADGQADLAERLYRRALDLEPDDVAVRIALAELYEGQDRFSAAEALLEAGVRRFPAGTALYLALARLYLRAGLPVKAAALLDGAENPYTALALSAKRPGVTARPRGGSYAGPVDFTLETRAGVDYFYELEGVWLPYTVPVRLAEGSRTVRVIAVSAEGVPSRVQSWHYTLTPSVAAMGEIGRVRCPFCGETFRTPQPPSDTN